MRNRGREGRLWPQVCGGVRGGGKNSPAGALETGPGGLFQGRGHREEKGGDEGGVAGVEEVKANQLKVSSRGEGRRAQRRLHVI